MSLISRNATAACDCPCRWNIYLLTTSLLGQVGVATAVLTVVCNYGELEHVIVESKCHLVKRLLHPLLSARIANTSG